MKYPAVIKHGNGTWTIYTTYFGDFPIETPISSGFPIATDETGGYQLFARVDFTQTQEGNLDAAVSAFQRWTDSGATPTVIAPWSRWSGAIRGYE